MNPIAWLSPARWLAVLALAGVLTAAYFGWREQQREIGREQERAEQRENDARSFARRMERQEDARREHAKTITQLQAARARADAAAGSLRGSVAELRARVDSATERQRETAAAALDVLADVLGRADARAGELADLADRARAAGIQCEREYDALTASPQP